jgi:hypothetical protein
MKPYSFDADLRSVLRRLAAAKSPAAMPVDDPHSVPCGKVVAFPLRPRQPRIELAHVALRRNRDAVT